MEIKQLVYFVAIVEEGTISKAAAALYMAQPPLSRQLKLIEDELGEVLFDRSNKKRLVITPKGELFYHKAKEILFQLEDSINEVRDLGENLSEKIKGGSAIYCSMLLLETIRSFHLTYSNPSFDLFEGSSTDLFSKLVNHEIDFALTIEVPEVSNLESTFLGTFPCVLVTQMSYPLVNETVTIEELSKLPLILLKPEDESGFFKEVLTVFAQHHLVPHIFCECNDATMLMELVKKGIGVTILPITMVKGTELKYFQIRDIPLSITPILSWRKNGYLSKASKKFLDTLKEINTL